MRDLLHHAAELGVRVHMAHLEDDLLGGYWADHNLVAVDMGLTPAEQRSVLAHELGHVYYGHDCDSRDHEEQADVYAAKILVDPAEYARIERIHPDAHSIADELGVTVDVIETFRRHCLTRMRGATYALPRIGRRQSAFWALDLA